MDRVSYWLKIVGEYAKDYVLENTGLKVLALLITAVLWLSVAGRPENRITISNVPIEFRDPPENLEVSKYEALAARVYLSGPRHVLDGITPSDLGVYADLSGIEPGVRVLPLQLDKNRLPAGVEGEVVDPRSIRITVERQLTREAEVQPRFEGEPPEGYEVYQWSISPATVQLTGAASNVEAVTEVSTETVSLSGRTESFRDEVAIDIGQTNVSVNEDRQTVTLIVIIGEERIERTFSRVPVIVSGEAGPQPPVTRFLTVTLFGARSAVNELSPADISAVIQLPGGANIPREVTPTITVLKHSDRVAVSSFEPKAVRLR